MTKPVLAFALILTSLYACNNSNSPGSETADRVAPTALINYAVTKFYPHDTLLYTEGFLINDGRLFESTGSPEDEPQTRSVIGIIDLQTGRMDKKIEIDRSKYFGEGIVILNEKLYQLTYTTQVGFIYDINTFKKTGQFTYPNIQGWGLATDGKNIIMGDGTDKLTFLDTATLKAVRTLSVTENGLPVDKLNELEYINGFIYANIWLTDFIVKIDPSTGKVAGRLDLTSLAFEARNKYPAAGELNGIAYDGEADKIYVTGKLWPNIYELAFPH
ncbi:MAG: glutaminyl-peptide cyclotransferase [Ferruginibacter sp.]